MAQEFGRNYERTAQVIAKFASRVGPTGRLMLSAKQVSWAYDVFRRENERQAVSITVNDMRGYLPDGRFFEVGGMRNGAGVLTVATALDDDRAEGSAFGAHEREQEAAAFMSDPDFIHDCGNAQRCWC